MQAVVLAGGRATRLGARTLNTPKYLLDCEGRPFAAWQLDRLATAGFTEVLLCIGHLGKAIRERLDGTDFGLKLRYAEDGPLPLGTLGALHAAMPQLAPTFLLTYGDSYLPFDYSSPLRDLNENPDALGTMSVYRNRDRFDRSNTEVTGSRISRYQKAGNSSGEFQYIDYGAIALRRDAIASYPPGPAPLERLQSELASRGALRALIVKQRFFEIGSESGLADFQTALREGTIDFPNSGAQS